MNSSTRKKNLVAIKNDSSEIVSDRSGQFPGQFPHQRFCAGQGRLPVASPGHTPASTQPHPGLNPATPRPQPSHTPASTQPHPGLNPASPRPQPSLNPATPQPQPGHTPASTRPHPSHTPATPRPHPGHTPASPRPHPGLTRATPRLHPAPGATPCPPGPHPAPRGHTLPPRQVLLDKVRRRLTRSENFTLQESERFNQPGHTPASARKQKPITRYLLLTCIYGSFRETRTVLAVTVELGVATGETSDEAVATGAAWTAAVVAGGDRPAHGAAAPGTSQRPSARSLDGHTRQENQTQHEGFGPGHTVTVPSA